MANGDWLIPGVSCQMVSVTGEQTVTLRAPYYQHRRRDYLSRRLPYCAARLPDNSVNMVLTDPPYFKVKGDAWDDR